MGVKGLLSLIEDCPEACRFVSIEKMAKDHQRAFRCSPVLAVDGSNVIPWLYTTRKNSLETIYGGQWIEFREVLIKFVQTFQNRGIKLVFIFDGLTCKDKLAKWIERKTSRYGEIATIFRDISQNFQEKAKARYHVPAALKRLAKFALKELGVKMYRTDKEMEADKYIADYANKNRAVFAILSDDSDFIILDTKPLLSISKLRLNHLKTVTYDRYCFSIHYLNLSPKQLPLFGCLMGNDYVPFLKIRKFHQRLSDLENTNKVATVKNLCKLIKEEKWTGNSTNKQELLNISSKIFGHENGHDLLKCGLESYIFDIESIPLTFCVRMSTDFERAVHYRHFNCLNTCIYSILCKKEYKSSETLEDGSMIPSALAYREIRQRCYGILFNCYVDPNKVKSIVIEERCWYKKNESENNNLKEPERIYPLPLRNPSSVKRVEDLWFNCPEIRRFEFFWHILQIPMDFDLLMKLPEDQIVLSCILNYLIGGRKSGPLLKPLDVAVFVAQAAWKPSLDDIKQLENPKIYASTVNLSSLFVNGISAVLMALETCGFPFPYKYALPWRFFDGKLFHFLHNEAKKRPRVYVLCNNQDEIIERFYKLLPVVTHNTMYDLRRFKWSGILMDF